uniref:Uncharacterized protein n=1 Tax=viral metagenome TaxID=1070528 RepID=A0A6C0BS32_9ZZZZ
MEHKRISINESFPSQDFAIKIIYIDNEFEKDRITVSIGENTKLMIGYNALLKEKTIEYQLEYDDGIIETFDVMREYMYNPNYNTVGENVIVFVVDNMLYKIISIYLNGTNIQFNPFSDSKKIKLDSSKHFIVSSTLFEEGAVVIESTWFQNVPKQYLIDSKPSATLTSKYPNANGGNSLALAQCPIYNGQNITKSWNNQYATTRDVGWVRNGDNQSLWGWIDMGREMTMERIRIWINSLVEFTPTYFRIYATNNVALTDSYLPDEENMYFFSYTNDINKLVEQNALSTGDNDNGVDYHNGSINTSQWHEFGKSNDPTRTITKNLNSGYHRYSFCNRSDYFTKYNRTGRYFFLEFYPAKYKTQIMELRIKGNYTPVINQSILSTTTVENSSGSLAFTLTKERLLDSSGKLYKSTVITDSSNNSKTMTKTVNFTNNNKKEVTNTLTNGSDNLHIHITKKTNMTNFISKKVIRLNADNDTDDYYLRDLGYGEYDFKYLWHSTPFGESASSPAVVSMKYRNSQVVENYYYLNGANDMLVHRFGKSLSGMLTILGSEHPYIDNIVKVQDATWFISFFFRKVSTSSEKRLFQLEFTKNWGVGDDIYAFTYSDGKVQIRIRLSESTLYLEKTYSLMNDNNHFCMSYNQEGTGTSKIRMWVNDDYGGYQTFTRVGTNSNSTVKQFKVGLSGDNNVLTNVLVGNKTPLNINSDFQVVDIPLNHIPYTRTHSEALREMLAK